MAEEVPSDIAPFVERVISQRQFLNEVDVQTEGLRLLQARGTLRDEVRKGFEQLDGGEGIPADDVYEKVEQLIANLECH